MKNIFTTKEQESIMDGYYYNGYYFLIPIWDTAPKGFEALDVIGPDLLKNRLSSDLGNN